MSHVLELLAPAGDWAALEAALDAGADALYFGLRTLNARRRAKNFSPHEFVKAVEAVHARGAKAYLTLNIDLAQREIGQAARILELARQCRATPSRSAIRLCWSCVRNIRKSNFICPRKPVWPTPPMWPPQPS